MGQYWPPVLAVPRGRIFLAPDGVLAAHGVVAVAGGPAEPSTRHTYRSPRCRTVSTSFAAVAGGGGRVCRSPDRCWPSLETPKVGENLGQVPGATWQTVRSACWSGPEARAYMLGS